MVNNHISKDVTKLNNCADSSKEPPFVVWVSESACLLSRPPTYKIREDDEPYYYPHYPFNLGLVWKRAHKLVVEINMHCFHQSVHLFFWDNTGGLWTWCPLSSWAHSMLHRSAGRVVLHSHTSTTETEDLLQSVIFLIWYRTTNPRNPNHYSVTHWASPGSDV